jgi:acetyl esterase/lipase
MAEKLASANPRSRLEIWPRMPHAWQLFAPVLPEARQAIGNIASFVASVDAA